MQKYKKTGLFDDMTNVLSVAAMRAAEENYARRHGGSTCDLMGAAGEGIYNAVNDATPSVFSREKRVAIVCGKGNNGGDGYALALQLHKRGIDTELFLLEYKFTSDSGYYFNLCKELGIQYRIIDGDVDFRDFDTIVDCIFGVGLRGAPDESVADIIRAINESGKYVISADINSGICGDSGIVETVAVKSNVTVAIGYPKPGHFLGSARDYIGKLVVADIGLQPVEKPYKLFEASDAAAVFPRRPHNSHKGTWGTAAIIGGSVKYSGAAKLANLAASSLASLKSGCGIARLVVPTSISHAVMPYLLESTLFPVLDKDGKIIFDEHAISEAISGTKSVAIGMGLGDNYEENYKILEYILTHHSGFIIIDADALNALAKHGAGILEKACGSVILTPHPAEFSRLCGMSVPDILRDPVKVAVDFAAKHKVTVLLKGTATVVASYTGDVYIVDRGCPGMATAGSGDVLAGIMAGVCAQSSPLIRDENFQAPAYIAAASAYIAGVAGELAEADTNPVSMTASDTVSHIGKAVSRVLSL